MYALRDPRLARWNHIFLAPLLEHDGIAIGIRELVAHPEPQRHAALIAAIARSKDTAAFEQLFAHFAPRLKTYLLRGGLDAPIAEELAQETMIAVWQKAYQYDPQRATAASWIFGIASNLRIDRFRRNRIAMLAKDSLDQPMPEPLADAILEADNRAERMRGAIDRLPLDQRSALHLAFFEDRSNAEIQSIQGIPLGTIKSRLRLALTKLRDALKD
jgi:RNA polymerase sigma-70 factor, ECF subfamily